MTARTPSVSPGWLGCLGTILITCGSYGAGAVRYEGGPLRLIGWDFLAYGHGGGISNAVFWAGLILVTAAWLLLGSELTRQPARESDWVPRCRALLLAWTTPLIFAGPILSRDVYSYLMQGAMVRDGFDPYSEGAAVNPGPFLLEVSHDWRNTTTPYGPIHLFLGRVITTLTGDHVTAGVICYKVVSLLGFAAIVWAVPRIATRLHSSPAWALWLGVANPVVLLHMVGGMHNEALMVGLVSLALVLALSCTSTVPRTTIALRMGAAVILTGIAIALKATAVIAMPFLVWIATAALTPYYRRPIPRFLIAGTTMTGLLGLIIVALTTLTGSSWGWVGELSGNSKVINPLSIPSLLAGLITPLGLLLDPTFSYNQLLGTLRTVCTIIMLLGLIAVWWIFRRRPADHVRGIVVAYCVALFFNSVTLPWYFASPLSLAGTVELPVWARRVAITLSVVVALTFTGSGNHKLYVVPLVTLLALVGYGAARIIVPHPSQSQARVGDI
ncbi:MAG: alpha-(1-_6)-mannopyranosyltransferase A [Corynebacterium sp.]|nr:alpha-(1->6)-mannopyranosyltransferase A [Corynebacterium sp.]